MTVLDLLDADARRSIAALPRSTVPRGTVLFRPGDEPGGFLLVTDGVIDVYLVGRSGREMLLYEVGSGQTCIQTTLCLLGRQPYSGEAVARTDAGFVMVPKAAFAELLASSEAFRSFVFGAFGNRGQYVIVIPSRRLVIVRQGHDDAAQRLDIAKLTAAVVAGDDKAGARK